LVIRYREARPSQPLRHFVETLWLLEQDAEAGAPQRIVPDGHPELILNWCQPCEYFDGQEWVRQSQCFFAGQIERPLLLRSNGRTKMLGVRFRANGAAALFKVSMGELSGRFTPVDELSSVLSRRSSRVWEAVDPFAAMNEALLSAWDGPQSLRDRTVEIALAKISAARGLVRIHRLARDLNLSTRQLERRFSDVVGLSPRVFSRILRFNQVFRYLEKPGLGWARTAADCGYYDQAHLIRDCNALAGTTPRVLLEKDGDLARHFYRRFGMSHPYNPAAGPSW
jgi:AraC-like DNA-binding protein